MMYGVTRVMGVVSRGAAEAEIDRSEIDLRLARRSPTWRTISFRSRACQSASQCAAYCPPHHSAALEAGSVPCARGVCCRVEEWESGRVEDTSLNSREIDMSHEVRDRTSCVIRHASRVEKLPAIKSSSEQRSRDHKGDHTRGCDHEITRGHLAARCTLTHNARVHES